MMTNKTELIGQQLKNWYEEKRYRTVGGFYSQEVEKAIAALSEPEPVLPEDVEFAIKELDEAATYYVNRSPIASGEEIGLANKCQTGIDMLRKLAKNAAYAREQARQWNEAANDDADENRKLRQRIAEMEKEIESYQFKIEATND